MSTRVPQRFKVQLLVGKAILSPSRGEFLPKATQKNRPFPCTIANANQGW